MDYPIALHLPSQVFVSDGAPTTPSRLANRQGCGSRNAWRMVWLRFPGASRWQRADHCRR